MFGQMSCRLLEYSLEERCLRAEVVMHETVVHPRGSRDLAYRDSPWPVVSEKLGGSLQECFFHRFAATRR
jgi:hypothetical protein